MDFEEKTTAQLKKHIKSMEHENYEMSRKILEMEKDVSCIAELNHELEDKDASIEELGKYNCHLVTLVED